MDCDPLLNKEESDCLNSTTERDACSTVQFDDILQSVSEFGPRQIAIYFLSCWFVIVPSGIQTCGVYFISGTPEFHCVTPNVSCDLNKCCNTCSNYKFDGPFYSTTSEWNLICDRDYINANVQAGYFIGMLIGSLVFGAVSDIFGRRFCMMLCAILAVLSSLGSAFVSSMTIFVFLRAATGACYTGFFVSQYVYMLELVGPRYRSLACNGAGIFWVIGEVAVVLMAYFIPYWRKLLFVTSLPPALCLLLWRFLPESPRWLVLRGRLDEACEILMKFADKSSVSLDPDALKNTLMRCHQGEVSIQQKTKKHSPLDLLRTARLRKRGFILWFNWLVIAMAFFGFVLYVSNLEGNPYLNVTYMYLSDVPSYGVVVLTLRRFGRRVTHCVIMVTSGVACLLVLLDPQGYNLATTVLAFLGRNLVNMAFSVIYLYSSELYPTSIRNLAVGTCSTSGRLGAIGAPYIVMLSQLPGVSVTLPLTIFGVLSIAAGLMILWLPETLNSNIPQTIEDLHKGKEYYGLIWMGKRVNMRCRAPEKKTLIEVPPSTYGTSTNSDPEEWWKSNQ